MLQCDTWMLFCLMINGGTIHPNCACSEHALQQALFENYNKKLRPVKDQSTKTTIKVNTEIYSIVSINERDESIDLVLWTSLLWQDEFLQWNPTHFDNCTSFYLPANDVWLPDYNIANQLDSVPIIFNDVLYVFIESNGMMTLWQSYYLTLRCPMDIAAFPFDTQICSIIGSIWIYDNTQINLTAGGWRTNLSAVLMNSAEFETVSFEGQETRNTDTLGYEKFQELHYYLKLRRRPEYYIFVLLIPSFLLTSLCIIGIFTPNSSTGDRNEKMTLGLTTLLSMAVILNITADAMPKSSKGLPLLGYYVLYEIGMCALATIFSTIIIFIHERAITQDWDPPTFIHWIADLKKPCDYLKNATVSAKYEKEYHSSDQPTLSKLSQQEYIKAVDSVMGDSLICTICNHEMVFYLPQVLSTIDDHLKMLKSDAENRKIWIMALDRIDLILLVVLLLLNCILTAVILF